MLTTHLVLQKGCLLRHSCLVILCRGQIGTARLWQSCDCCTTHAQPAYSPLARSRACAYRLGQKRHSICGYPRKLCVVLTERETEIIIFNMPHVDFNNKPTSLIHPNIEIIEAPPNHRIKLHQPTDHRSLSCTDVTLCKRDSPLVDFIYRYIWARSLNRRSRKSRSRNIYIYNRVYGKLCCFSYRDNKLSDYRWLRRAISDSNLIHRLYVLVVKQPTIVLHPLVKWQTW